MGRMNNIGNNIVNNIVEALEAINPTPQDVLGDTATFSPIRWKTGWPHHLRRVPPFRDDATASITRSEVFDFAADVRESGFAREQIIDFLGACFGYTAGQSNDVMQLQALLRNKGKAAQLLAAIRKLEGQSPIDAYTSLTNTGLAPKYASAVAYFIAGQQEEGEADKPVIICSKRAEAAGIDTTGDWSGEQYGEYLNTLREARDAFDASLPLDAVEWAVRKHATEQG